MRAAIATKASGLFFATLRTASKPSSAQTGNSNEHFSIHTVALENFMDTGLGVAVPPSSRSRRHCDRDRRTARRNNAA